MTRILHISMIPVWVLGKRSGMPTTQRMIDYYSQKDTVQLYVHFSSNTKIVETHIENNIEQINVPIPQYLSKKNTRMPFAIRNKLLILYLLIFRKNILKIIERSFNPDIIISHLQISGLISKVLFTTRRNQFLRLYGTQRTYDFIKKHWYRYTNWENIFPFILNMSGYILVNDGTNSMALAKMFNVEKRKILFIRNGVDTVKKTGKIDKNSIRKSMGIPDNAIAGIHVNRLHYFKSIDSLVYFINNTCNDIHWIIIGDGPDAKKLKLINSQANVHWLKAVDNNKLDNYYEAADFLVNFNILSTLNNPNYEALRNHLPVFALKKGYGCEAINQVLIARETVAELTDAFNEKYYKIISEKNHDYNALIKQIANWEKDNLYTWNERYEKEWKFIIKRINDVEKDC